MGAPAVTVYTAGFCGYCIRVKSLLERRGIPYAEVSVEDHAGLREELLARSGRRTLPQVFVGDRFVGGADEIAAMDRDGGLSRFLQSEE
ncbi:MAG: glutathione S-transferase N-terminal domain-containing protein [Steroidobacteraceae bacterium]|nr:glutathione S-transferase N-terminal domain-containing protein [Steroidobacteraceae bacterium]